MPVWTSLKMCEETPWPPDHVSPGLDSGLHGAELGDLPVRDPRFFVAGQLHSYPKRWSEIFEASGASEQLTDWLTHGVNIRPMFRHFRGHQFGRFLDSRFPPPIYLPNSQSRPNFQIL